MKGVVYNIQRYSLHDGPGIRTTVFFKGCPLRCRWCCNPESQSPRPEISYVRARCIGKAACGLCGAETFDSEGKAVIDRSGCPPERAANCPARAIRVEGREYAAAEILEAAERDEVFGRNGGGLTVSGGEPLMQPEFLSEILVETRRRHIHVALETCGHGTYQVLREAAELLDLMIYDLKSLDAAGHKEFTGFENDLIVENFEMLCGEFPNLPKLVRTPVIPGFNDRPQDIEKIAAYLAGKPGATLELLPYHRFGAGKYAALGREYPMGGAGLSGEMEGRIENFNENPVMVTDGILRETYRYM